MKNIIRYVCATAIAATLLLSTSAWAGECCKKAAAAAKSGKTCSHCETKQCCKDTVAKMEKDGKVKACEKCAKAKEDKKS